MNKILWILALVTIASPAAALQETNGIKQWNMWRGPNRDGITAEKGLLTEWPDGGPELLWKSTRVGGGYSSVSLWDDHIFLLGDSGDDCFLYCLDAKNGEEVWKSRVCEAGTHRDYPGPRSTPATDGKFVVALGETGDLVCVDAKDGKRKWKKHMERDFGGRMMSKWKWSESPLLDGKNVIVTPGGRKGAVVALDLKTGKTAWQSTDLKGERAAYTSLVPVEIGKVRQYILLTNKTVAGIAAKNGKLVWKTEREGETAVIPTPIYHDGIVFVTSGYKAGCQGFRVTGSRGRFRVKEIYSGRQMENHHGGCIRVGDYVYGVGNRGRLKCIELKTGKEMWASNRIGKGSIAYADGHLIVRSESKRRGTIRLIEATPDEYKEKSSFNQPDLSGKSTWPHPVIFGGKMYIRDQNVLLCYDLQDSY